MATWTEQDSIDLSARLVADDGYRMPLTGDERRAAVERMIAAGHNRATIAHRLHLTDGQLRHWAKGAGVTLPCPEGQAWWVEVAHPHKSRANRRRYAAEQAVRQVAA